ncbi:MAG: CDP-alcohol phosphatidyltransferase family protein [Dermatophilaceae bacterium]
MELGRDDAGAPCDRMREDRVPEAHWPGGRMPHDRIWTVPNLLTMLRMLGVPVFLALIVTGRDGWALLVLAVSGITDYVDGALARRLRQVTRLGQLLDPVADRLFILSTMVGLLVRGLLPWWFVAALLARDLAGSILVRRVRKVGYRGVPVNFLGKAATFNLLYAFTLLLLAAWQPDWARWVLPVAWAFAWWGLALYWQSFAMYAVQARAMLTAAIADQPDQPGPAKPVRYRHERPRLPR